MNAIEFAKRHAEVSPNARHRQPRIDAFAATRPDDEQRSYSGWAVEFATWENPSGECEGIKALCPCGDE